MAPGSVTATRLLLAGWQSWQAAAASKSGLPCLQQLLQLSRHGSFHSASRGGGSGDDADRGSPSSRGQRDARRPAAQRSPLRGLQNTSLFGPEHLGRPSLLPAAGMAAKSTAAPRLVGEDRKLMQSPKVITGDAPAPPVAPLSLDELYNKAKNQTKFHVSAGARGRRLRLAQGLCSADQVIEAGRDLFSTSLGWCCHRIASSGGCSL